MQIDLLEPKSFNVVFSKLLLQKQIYCCAETFGLFAFQAVTLFVVLCADKRVKWKFGININVNGKKKLIHYLDPNRILKFAGKKKRRPTAVFRNSVITCMLKVLNLWGKRSSIDSEPVAAPPTLQNQEIITDCQFSLIGLYATQD